MAYVRTVKTASGARAVRIVHGFRRGARKIEQHLGSTHDEKALEALKATARQRQRVNAELKNWRILRKIRSSPNHADELVAAVQTLMIASA